MPINERHCRFCGNTLRVTFIDLGTSPFANSYLREEDLVERESFYPLHLFVCTNCFLVQLDELGSPQEIFTEYAYFSSFSESWLQHSSQFATEAIKRFDLDSESHVVEIGSNDGYLLQYFREKGIPVLGIDPATNVAEVAEKKGVETVVAFFTTDLARKLASTKQADLIIGNNVLAHIPATNDLMAGLKVLLKPDGVISMEFPYLLRLMEENQFDTIYHEHYSYFSLSTAVQVFCHHGFRIFDVDILPTHGGSLRIYACHSNCSKFATEKSLSSILEQEEQKGYRSIDGYRSFSKQVEAVKRNILKKLIAIKEENLSIAAYGAPAKGNTLLNYCGIGKDFIDFTVDRSPYKQGLFLPGSRIPIYDPGEIERKKPDYLLILPWNLREEIAVQNSFIRDWGGKYLVLIPDVEVF